MTLDEASAQLERTPSSLSKIETGRVAVRVRDLRVILQRYGVQEEQRVNALLALARDGRKRGWWQNYGDVLSWAYQEFISLEADASAVRSHETILIPGLLQTEDYARAVHEAVPPPPGIHRDIDRLVAVRRERQGVLGRERPLELWAILDEAAFHRRFGGRKVMRAQLERLLEASSMDNVTIQVVPFAAGGHAGINGPFTILEFPELVDLDVILVENLTSGLYLEDETDIRRYNVVFNHLRMTALPETDSVALIQQLARDL
ncbi:helix-turn-helix domain-containing protein [Actinoallomurus spadix]|nr:helix-turn-helix domain-containing protein [Actinoallomurus spadix]